MGKTLTPARYRWEFPIMIPSRLPQFNFWLMSFCKPKPGDNPHGTCYLATDPEVLVTFPLASFKIGEVHPSAFKNKTGATCRQHGPWSYAFVAVLWTVLFLFAW